MRLGKNLVSFDVFYVEILLGEERSFDGHITKDQIGAVLAEFRQITSSFYPNVSIDIKVPALADITHEYVSKHLVIALYLPEGIKMELKVLMIILEILSTDVVHRQVLLAFQEGILYLRQSLIKLVVSIGGEGKVLIRVEIKFEIDIVFDKGLHEKDRGYEWNDQKFNINELVKVDLY